MVERVVDAWDLGGQLVDRCGDGGVHLSALNPEVV